MDTKLHTLIPLEDFKALLGVDDREDKISRFCLVTASCSIEQYCKRRFLFKNHHEWIGVENGLLLPLKEYPVREILTVSSERLAVNTLSRGCAAELIEPDFYHTVPDCGTDVDLPFYLSLSPALLCLPGRSGFKVVYSAGYACSEVPPDLASACLELAGWNLNRYRNKWIGVTGNIRKGAEYFEAAMPENVRLLLKPYKRKLI